MLEGLRQRRPREVDAPPEIGGVAGSSVAASTLPPLAPRMQSPAVLPESPATAPSAGESLSGLVGSESIADLAALASESELLRRLAQRSATTASSSSSSSSAAKAAASLRSAATASTVSSPVGSNGRATTLDAPVPSSLPRGRSGGASPTCENGVPALFAATLPLVRQGAGAIVDDSFTRCFKSQKRTPWNWNVYLAPAWAFGVVIRYGVLFPLRALALALGFGVTLACMPFVKLAGLCCNVKRAELALIHLLASAFVASWSGVVRIHGLRPAPRHGRPAGIFVANHSSMIDFIVLIQSHAYAVVGQKHPGWVGLLQDTVLSVLKPLWFNRGQSKDRKAAAALISEHCRDPANNSCPLLIFPEGTCVNNEYVVQFKKFVFELGVPINPIAIKYNKVFVDAYWNSREQSFLQHLLRLMTSWAVVVDVWFLDQQNIRPGETAADFATRIQRMVAARAGIKVVDWDGYMKYWKPNERFLLERQKLVSYDILSGLGMALPAPTADEAAAAHASAQQAVE